MNAINFNINESDTDQIKQISTNKNLEQNGKDIYYKINNLKIVATWKYDVLNEKCPICHQNIMSPTQKSINDKIINGNVSVGKCGHAYHEDCINRWLLYGFNSASASSASSINNKCAVCNLPWSVEKNVSSAVYIYENV